MPRSSHAPSANADHDLPQSRRIGPLPPALLRLVAIAICAAAAAMGCGGGAERGMSDTAVPGEQSAVEATPAASSDSIDDCPKYGAWQDCSVLDRLERAGVAPSRGDSVRVALFTPPGARFTVGVQELTVFLYADAAALERDLTAIDTVRVQPRRAGATPIMWSGEPTLIVSNNMAAVLTGGRERQTERVRNALTAGLPAAAARAPR